MNRRILIGLFCFLSGATVSVFAQDLTITNARIIGPNASLIERGSILVRGGTIVSVAPGTPNATSGTIIDARGMTAMPGFIDGTGISTLDPTRSSRSTGRGSFRPAG